LEKQLSDIEIIKKVLNGDTNLYKTIIDRYKGKVASVVKSIVSDKPEAEEIGQEVFIKLYNNLANFKGDSKLETYIIRIALNLSYNEVKRQERRWTIFSNKTTDNDYIKDISYSNENQRDNKEVVKLALKQLKAKDRAIINLRLMQQYTSKETAEILKIPMGTVLSRLSRAQEKLKEIIKEIDKSIEN
jgi:RNA polymerase sigma-70 factor (ECF subfamily)